MDVLKKARTADGFTLPEALVAILLLAIVLLATMPLFIAAMQSNGSAFDYTMANTLAKEKIEELMLIPSGDPSHLRLATGSTSLTVVDTVPKFYFRDKTSATPVADPYTRTAVVQEFLLADLVTAIPASPTTKYDVKRVDVTVRSTRAGLRGLRGVTESAFLRNSNSYAGNPGY